MKTILLYVKFTLAQLAQLDNPIADVALVGLVVKLLPFVHVSTSKLVEILAAVGLIAAYLTKRLSGVSRQVAAEKAKK